MSTIQRQLTKTDNPCYRFIINDTYRSELCLLYPPHLIAIAAIYLTFVLHEPTRRIVVKHLGPPDTAGTDTQPSTPAPQPRRSSRQALHASTSSNTSDTSKKTQDPVTFLAELNVSMPLIATISQEIISLYTLWDMYKEDSPSQGGSRSRELPQSPFSAGSAGSRSGSGSKRSAPGSRSGSLNSHGHSSNSNGGTPTDDLDAGANVGGGMADGTYITPAYLAALLLRMREGRLADMAHPASGRPVAINKMLERTQAAG